MRIHPRFIPCHSDFSKKYFLDLQTDSGKLLVFGTGGGKRR